MLRAPDRRRRSLHLAVRADHSPVARRVSQALQLQADHVIGALPAACEARRHLSRVDPQAQFALQFFEQARQLPGVTRRPD